jgi:hypothetical protein
LVLILRPEKSAKGQKLKPDPLGIGLATFFHKRQQLLAKIFVVKPEKVTGPFIA